MLANFKLEAGLLQKIPELILLLQKQGLVYPFVYTAEVNP